MHVRARPGVIEVVDTGVGLAPEDIPHAFERFYLHDRVGIPDGGRWSSGLGLAIVKELCERMDGRRDAREHARRRHDVHGAPARASACASAARPLGSALMARRDVLVLCYHGIAPGSLHGEVTPDALHASAERTWLRAATGGRRSPTPCWAPSHERVAAITFDDGIASAVEHGLPILDDFGAPGTMFLTVEMLGWGGRLDAAGAARLAERGWEIGSHTMTHPVLTNVDDGTLKAELRESKRQLESLVGRPCTAVSYPTGRCDARVVRRPEAAGYVAGAALEGASCRPARPARVAARRRARRRQPARVPGEDVAGGAERALVRSRRPVGTVASAGRAHPPLANVGRRRAARRSRGRAAGAFRRPPARGATTTSTSNPGS